MKFQYKTIDTRSIRGIQRAERLKATGWRIIRTGLFSIQFEKPLIKKASAPNPINAGRKTPITTLAEKPL